MRISKGEIPNDVIHEAEQGMHLYQILATF